VKYELIRTHPEYPVTKWAACLDVSTSAYYDWLANRDKRDERQEKYAEAIKRIFERSGKTYGVDRICGCLRKEGYTASYKRVKKIMDELGLISVHRRRRQRSLTDSRKARGPGYPNLVQNLDITKPFQVISSDISYIRTAEGFEYLCTVKDVVTGLVLAHTMADNMKVDLVERTLTKAFHRWPLLAGCIHHSDRGSQFTAESVAKLLQKHGIQQSFSRVGKPGDNPWSESFFANLKKEAVHWRHFQTRAEARQAIFAYIEGFYNTRRVQKRLGYLSPLEWLNQYQELSLVGVA
jgi:putative transposase